MDLVKVLALVIYIYNVEVYGFPQPGHHHHVHHRIIVPQKIQTIHHTKIVKVPEHHHYFHEKEKVVHIETPHKEDFKLPLENEHEDDFSDFDSHYFGDGQHNIYKKHAPAPSKKSKKTTVTRGKKRSRTSN